MAGGRVDVLDLPAVQDRPAQSKDHRTRRSPISSHSFQYETGASPFHFPLAASCSALDGDRQGAEG